VLSPRDFELLLPWYVNGTLSDQERKLVAAYLKQHPEEDARVRWHSSLRAGIKEQVDELPEDLGLDRVLAVVRRDTSRAPGPSRTGLWRYVSARVAAWVASLDLLRGAPARWGAGSWAVASLAALVVVSGSVAFLVIDTNSPPMTIASAPQPAPMQPAQVRPPAMSAPLPAPMPQPQAMPRAAISVPAENRMRQVASAEPPAVASQAASREKTGSAKKEGPVADSVQRLASAAPVGAIQQAPETPGKRSAVPPSTQLPQPSTPPAADESNVASAATPGTRQQETPPSPSDKGGSEPTQLAAYPADASTPPSGAGTTAALAVPLRNIAPPSRAALSGKENTSCPSPNKQREDALRAANPDQPVRTPAAWLEYIKELSKAGCREAAAKEWIEFHKKYPDEKIPPELTGSP
jgi:hypothetical protein